MKERRKKITWTDEEREALANQWAELRLDNPFKLAGELLNEAQRKALPEARRRPDLQFAQDERLKNSCEAKYKEFFSEIRDKPVIIIEQSKPVPIDIGKVLAGIPARELKVYAEERLQQEFLSRVADIVKANNLAGNGTHTTTELISAALPLSVRALAPVEPEVNKYRVALIGCNTDEVDSIRRKVAQDTEVTPVNKSKGVKDESLPIKCDTLIIYHAQQGWGELGAKKYGSQNVHFVKGGAPEIVKKIMQLRSVWIAQNSTPKTK